jgi:DNA-binding beta-propeller fold protein YncE
MQCGCVCNLTFIEFFTLWSVFMKKVLLHRFLLAATAFCFLAIVMAGCGGSGSGNPGGTTTKSLTPLNIAGVVTTLAGSATSFSDGTGRAAGFNNPDGITTDGTNLYVADTANHEIRKIVMATGVVSTLAGSTKYGHADGTGTAASFDSPEGITIDPAGTNLYVADTGNHEIRKVVIATGAVTTIAGSTTSGYADGTGTAAGFNYPYGITIDSTGTNLYVVDTDNNEIRKVVIATGVVSTLAGTINQGNTDGTGTAASFCYPVGITIDSTGTNLYVTDTGWNKIRKIVISTAAVSTLAGGSSDGGNVDGTGTAARFNSPYGITIDSTGTSLYVMDSSNHEIRKIVIATGVVSTVAGTGTRGCSDGTGIAASFYYPHGITAYGANLYIADTSNNEIRKMVIATGVVTTLAGSDNGADGTGSAARFFSPCGVATDGTNLYVVDSSNYEIRKIVIATGVVTTLAGSPTSGYADGTGSAARFYKPEGVAIDPAGTNLYVADSRNNMIRKIVIATGVVSTLAGSTTKGSADGKGSAASFNYPEGITIDLTGTNLYVSDTDNNEIRKIVIATGVVSTLAGSTTKGSADGTGSAASFNYPYGITTDGTSLYVTDEVNHEIRKIVIATGVVSTLAGSTSSGSADGTGSAAGFHYPYGITTDGINLYVADSENYEIRKIVIATGVVSTLAGSTTGGHADGTGSAASFYNPDGITTDGTSLYVTDSKNNMIRIIK